jgi:hypothetical protein
LVLIPRCLLPRLRLRFAWQRSETATPEIRSIFSTGFAAGNEKEMLLSIDSSVQELAD